MTLRLHSKGDETYSSHIHYTYFSLLMFFLPNYGYSKFSWYSVEKYSFFFSWGNCRGQHIWSAMDKPCPGKTTFVIMVFPLPGKYREDIFYLFLVTQSILRSYLIISIVIYALSSNPRCVFACCLWPLITVLG